MRVTHGCIMILERLKVMKKILFLNCSTNESGNTYTIGEKLLEGKEHEVLQMVDYHVCQYGQVTEEDEISKIFSKIDEADILVFGAPVYWYTVGGLLKTFIDRLYMLPEAEKLQGKEMYLFAQGSAPDEATKESITFLANRVASLMGMDLKSVVVDNSSGSRILKEMTIE